MNLPRLLPPDSSEAELQAFDTTCERLAGFADEINFESIDGFLTALAAGPSLPEPEDWLPAMCGDAFERAFADPEVAGDDARSVDGRALWEEPSPIPRTRPRRCARCRRGCRCCAGNSNPKCYWIAPKRCGCCR